MKYFLLLFGFLFLSCDMNEKNDIGYYKKPENENYYLQLDHNDWFYAVDQPVKIISTNLDSFGIPLWNYKGENYYHPVFLAQLLLKYLGSYEVTQDPNYMNQLKNIFDNYNELVKDNDYWYPYEFEFLLHGYSEEVMTPPWYSGMAQGQMLSVASRLYKHTLDPDYLNIANTIFEKLNNDYLNKEKGIMLLDDDNYIWIEEYPTEGQINYTLNGFLFAIIGLFDFYKISRNEVAHELIQCCITSAKVKFPEFRNESGLSYYCLTHKVESLHYHNVHIEQYNELFNITADSVFYFYANQLKSDYP